MSTNVYSCDFVWLISPPFGHEINYKHYKKKLCEVNYILELILVCMET